MLTLSLHLSCCCTVLPPQALGKYLLLVGVVAVFNSLASFAGQQGSRKVYTAAGAQGESQGGIVCDLKAISG